jgi:hypothetical protein
MCSSISVGTVDKEGACRLAIMEASASAGNVVQGMTGRFAYVEIQEVVQIAVDSGFRAQPREERPSTCFDARGVLWVVHAV